MHSSIYYILGSARGCVRRACFAVLLILFAVSAQGRVASREADDEVGWSVQEVSSDSMCMLQDTGFPSADSYAQADSLLASTLEPDTIVPSSQADSVAAGVVLADVVVTGGDSLEVADALNRKHLLANTRTYRMVCVGLPLVAGGLLAMKEDKNFRSLRTDYLPHYKHTADDYLQYSPAVVMVGLKAAGVRSR